jgi:hypothetical protein
LVSLKFGFYEPEPPIALTRSRVSGKCNDFLVYDPRNIPSNEMAILTSEDLTQRDRKEFARGGALRFAIERALAALRVGFSPYRAKEMPGRYWKPLASEDWRRHSRRHAKPPIAPNIRLRAKEGFQRLKVWEQHYRVPVIVVQVFDQEAFAVRLSEVVAFLKQLERCASDEERVVLQETRGIFARAYSSRGSKTVISVSPVAATKVGDVEELTVSAYVDIDRSKRYVARISIAGGRLIVSPEFPAFLMGGNRNLLFPS